MNGYFSTDCEEIDLGPLSSDTQCPMNKYWVGIRRNNGRDDDIKQLHYKCCRPEYHAPLTGDFPLPKRFKIND